MMPPPFTLVPNVGWVPTVEMTVHCAVSQRLAHLMQSQIAYPDKGRD